MYFSLIEVLKRSRNQLYFIVGVKKFDWMIHENLFAWTKKDSTISFTLENLNMFNITSKYFKIFNNKPPVGWVAHITRDSYMIYFFIYTCLHILFSVFCCFSSEICVFINLVSLVDEVPNFRNRIRTSHKSELMIKKYHWNCMKNNIRSSSFLNNDC